VAALRGHTGSIRGVKFNRWSSSLGLDTLGSATGDIEIVTCGEDKSVKLWNLGVHACMDSFYGHTSPITSMDIIQPNKPLTVGEDNTARLWK
ncbi:wd g-beta repeat-containing protein, partial [Cystoisospora suis]